MCAENDKCGCTASPLTLRTAGAIRPGQSFRTVDAATVRPPPPIDAALVAAGARDAETGLPLTWHAVLAVEGLRTTDHRAVARGALEWRQLPLALYAQFDNDGHRGASLVGSITSITRDGDYVMGEGTFDLGSDDGREAARMCDAQVLRWGSMDLEVLDSQLVEVGVGAEADIADILFGDNDGEGEADWYEEVLLGRIMGWTMVGFPAFPQCVMAPSDMALDIPEPMGTAPVVAEGMMAAGVTVPDAPPAAWFADPRLDAPSSLTVDGDGRIYGHLALWGTCHTGVQNSCVRPPHTATDYAYFRTGEIETAAGERIRVGQITFDTGHAGTTLGWKDTTAHYDHTGAAAADVAVGEDAFGIWFAGALRPGLSGDDLRVVRASALSGDWRKIGGKLELVAALAVNVPGFPIVASAGLHKGEQVSLVASSVPRRDPVREVAREVAQLRELVDPLLPLIRDTLRERITAAAPPAPVVSIEDLRGRIVKTRTA